MERIEDVKGCGREHLKAYWVVNLENADASWLFVGDPVWDDATCGNRTSFLRICRDCAAKLGLEW